MPVQARASGNKYVVDMFYHMVSENIGTTGSVRCIHVDDSEDKVYLKNVVEIIKYLDIQHPVGLYLLKMTSNHEDVFGCGVRSMLFLLGQLHVHVQELTEQGVPLVFIEELLNEAVDDCISGLPSIAIPVSLSNQSPLPSQSSPPISSTSSLPSAATHFCSSYSPVHPARDNMCFHQGRLSAHSSTPSLGPRKNVHGTNECDNAATKLETGKSGKKVTKFPEVDGLQKEVTNFHCDFEIDEFEFDSPDPNIASDVVKDISNLDGNVCCDASSMAKSRGNIENEYRPFSKQREPCTAPLTSMPKVFPALSGTQRLRIQEIDKILAGTKSPTLPGHKTATPGMSVHKKVMQSSRHLIRDDNSVTENNLNGLSNHQEIKNNVNKSATDLNINHRVMQSSRHLIHDTNIVTKATTDDLTDHQQIKCDSQSAADTSSCSKVIHGSRHLLKDSNTSEGNGKGGPLERQQRKSFGPQCRLDTKEAINTPCVKGDNTYDTVDKRGGHIHKPVNSLPHIAERSLPWGSVHLPQDAGTLGHGMDEMMPWAQETMHGQLVQNNLSRFNTGLIHTSCLSGSSGSHRLVSGLVLEADVDSLEIISRMTASVSALLINGDLTANYKHRGYKAVVTGRQVVTERDLLHQHQDSWHSQVFHLLKQLGVGVVLVRGVADADLKMQCVATGIAIVDRVSYRALQVLHTSCQVEMLTYVLHAQQDSCAKVYMNPVQEDWCDSLCTDRSLVLVTSSLPIQTLVISHPTVVGRNVLEEEFWRCVAHLVQAADDGRVLPGGGATEQWCARRLSSPQTETVSGRRTKWSSELALYRPLVRSALATSFHAYTRAVKQNRERAGYRTDDVYGSSRNCSDTLRIDLCPQCQRKVSFDTHAYACTCLSEEQGPRHTPQLKQDNGQHLTTGRGSRQPSLSSASLFQRKAKCCIERSAAVFDNYESKVKGWQSAVMCVCTVLRMGAVITTGLDQQTSTSNGHLL